MPSCLHLPAAAAGRTCGAAIRESLGRVVIVQNAALPPPPGRGHRRQPGVDVGPALQQRAGTLASVGGEGVPPSRHLVSKGPGLLEGRTRHSRRRRLSCWRRSPGRRGGRTRRCCVACRRRRWRLGGAGPLLLPRRGRPAAAADHELLLLAGRLPAAARRLRMLSAALQVARRPPPAPAAAPHAQPHQQHCAAAGAAGRRMFAKGNTKHGRCSCVASPVQGKLQRQLRHCATHLRAGPHRRQHPR